MGIISKDELKKALSKEELDKVSGGYVFEILDGFDAEGPLFTYEVIDDDTGNVMESFDYLDQAREYARSHGMSGERINWDQLKAIREKAGS